MKSNTLMATIVTALLILLLAPVDADAGWRGDRKFSTMYVFGDSLSDPGNAFAATGATAPGGEPIPSAPYDVNGHRFTNGPTWVEVLAREALLLRGALPALKYPRAGNYAFGGARAGSDTPGLDLNEQVGLFLTNNGFVAPSDALYVIEFGGNDVNAALSASPPLSPLEAQARIAEAVNAIKQHILLLKAHGARNFLIANVPNLAEAPVVRALGADEPALALTMLFNGLLEAAIAEIDDEELEIYRIDFFNYLNAATVFPTGNGFEEAPNPLTAPCLPVFVPPLGVCDNPDQRLFWDGIHPTRAAHRVVGNIAYNVLGIAGE